MNYFASEAFDEEKLHRESKLGYVHVPSPNVIFADLATM
jgi:hypothetical protein